MLEPRMSTRWGSALFEPASVSVAFFLAYWWVNTPTVSEYSLQLSAGLFLIYFLTKRLRQSKLYHLMPSEESLETALLVGAVAVVVGSSGALSSPFLPLFYLLLFVSVMTVSLPTNLVEMMSLLVFLWASSTHPLTTNSWLELLSLPLLLPLMLFARWQFEEAEEDKYRLEQEETLLASQETNMLMFLSTYLLPKLRQLRAMLILSELNRPSVAQQLAILEQESQRIMQDIDRADDSEVLAAQVAQQASQNVASGTADPAASGTTPISSPDQTVTGPTAPQPTPSGNPL